jgi:hypothetical protein
MHAHLFVVQSFRIPFIFAIHTFIGEVVACEAQWQSPLHIPILVRRRLCTLCLTSPTTLRQTMLNEMICCQSIQTPIPRNNPAR